MTQQPYISVRDSMAHVPRCIEGLATVTEAVRIMREAKTRALVIEKRHEGDEYGIVSIHDVAEKVIAKGRSPDRVSVYEIMSKPAITVDAEMDVRYAVRLLTRFRLSRALVMNKDELIGVVTLWDMVMRFTEEDERAEE